MAALVVKQVKVVSVPSDMSVVEGSLVNVGVGGVTENRGILVTLKILGSRKVHLLQCKLNHV